MAPTVTQVTSKTKPLKPYRRGETLGKASRQGKVPKTQLPGAAAQSSYPSTSASILDQEGSSTKGANTKEGSQAGEVPKRRKKGKKFMDNPESMLALISSITAEKDSVKKAKLKKVKAAPTAATLESQQKIKETLRRTHLDAAKAAVSARSRAAKIEKRIPPEKRLEESVLSDPTRKQVAFA